MNHAANTRIALAQKIRDLIDAGSGAGKLKFRDGTGLIVATLTLSDPCGTVSGAVLTFSAITSDTNAAGGTIVDAVITDSDDAIVLFLTVGLAGSGSDVEIDNLIIPATGTVACSSLTYTAPA